MAYLLRGLHPICDRGEVSPEHLQTRSGPRNLDLVLEEISETSICTLERALVVQAA